MSAGKKRVNGPKDEEPPSSVELALACLVATLEERWPGIANRWVEHTESDALHTEVRRLHSQAPNPVLVERLNGAMTLARNVRFVVLSHVRPVEKKRRRDRG